MKLKHDNPRKPGMSRSPFISRWTIKLECKYDTPSSTCLVYFRVKLSFNLPCCFRWSCTEIYNRSVSHRYWICVFKGLKTYLSYTNQFGHGTLKLYFETNLNCSVTTALLSVCNENKSYYKGLHSTLKGGHGRGRREQIKIVDLYKSNQTIKTSNTSSLLTSNNSNIKFLPACTYPGHVLHKNGNIGIR